MLNYSIPKFPGNLPWFLFDLTNFQLITSKIIPGDIKDSKDIILVETPIPGLNYQPITPGSQGNRKLNMTIPLIKRNNTIGNILLLKQFEVLRNQGTGLIGFRPGQFAPTPKVLYNWGVGSVPLAYWVSRVEITHKQGWTNALGAPQYSEIDLELILDETGILYKAEEIFRKFSSIAGEALQAFDVTSSIVTGGRPY